MSKIRKALNEKKQPSMQEINQLLSYINKAANSTSSALVDLNFAARKSKLKGREIKKAIKATDRAKQEIFNILEDMLDVVTDMKRKAGEL